MNGGDKVQYTHLPNLHRCPECKSVILFNPKTPIETFRCVVCGQNVDWEFGTELEVNEVKIS